MWCCVGGRVGQGEASLGTACQVLCTSNGGPSHVSGGQWRAVCVQGESSVVLGAVLYGPETGVLHHAAVLQGYRTRRIGRYAYEISDVWLGLGQGQSKREGHRGEGDGVLSLSSVCIYVCVCSVLVQSVVDEMRSQGAHTSLTAPTPTQEAARAFFRALGWSWEEGDQVMHLHL